jgi:hypothetical protein
MIYSPNSSGLTFSNLLKLCPIVFPTTDTFNLPALALSVVINNLLSWSLAGDREIKQISPQIWGA